MISIISIIVSELIFYVSLSSTYVTYEGVMKLLLFC